MNAGFGGTTKKGTDVGITGGFGTTMDLERGTSRQWVMGSDGVKRWADSGEPVGPVATLDEGYQADQDDEMTVGLDCCPHYVPYGSDCDECDEDDADMAMGLTPNAELTGRASAACEGPR